MQQDDGEDDLDRKERHPDGDQVHDNDNDNDEENGGGDGLKHKDEESVKVKVSERVQSLGLESPSPHYIEEDSVWVVL